MTERKYTYVCVCDVYIYIYIYVCMYVCMYGNLSLRRASLFAMEHLFEAEDDKA